MDLRKAFDTIDHGILLKKVEYMGLRGITLKWVASYLNNRKQYVSFLNENSSYADVVCGVPQGSILGPLLFILYINDICNISNYFGFTLFADDTTIVTYLPYTGLLGTLLTLTAHHLLLNFPVFQSFHLLKIQTSSVTFCAQY